MNTPFKVFCAIASAALIFFSGYAVGIKQMQPDRYSSFLGTGALSITDTTTGEVKVFKLYDEGTYRFNGATPSR